MRIFLSLVIAMVSLAESAHSRGPAGAGQLRDLHAGKAALIYQRVDRNRLAVSIIRQKRQDQMILDAPEAAVDRLAAQLLDGLVPDIAAVSAQASPPEFDAAAAHDLFELLVEPLMDQLAEVDRLAITADGALAALPFDALLTALPAVDLRDTHAYAAYPWLRNRFVISRFARTARPIEGMLDAPRASGGLLGFGNPALAGHGAFPLPPLPEANLELAMLRLSLHGRPGTIAVGALASEARFKKALASTGDLAVLALATHGARIAGRDDDAVLMFSEGEGEDGVLTADEVRSLRFRADLVILSACDSGAEALVDAFIEAGGDRVLALRWPVLSDVARQISTNVVAMTQRDADLPHDLALWQAVGRLISGGTSPFAGHPMIWAPFVLTSAAT